MSDPAPVPADQEEAPYVLMKRGLYWMPDAQGYTGVLAKAGRYTAQKARAYTDDGQNRSVVAILASEADEFSPACWEETKIAVLKDQIATLRAERDQFASEIASLRSATGDGGEAKEPHDYEVIGTTYDGVKVLRSISEPTNFTREEIRTAVEAALQPRSTKIEGAGE